MGVEMDLVVESRGHCFLCLTHVKSDPQTASPDTTQLYSLQSLSRYLHMDMAILLCQHEVIVSHLRTEIEKSILKTELCNACASLMNRFSQLHLQLEKIKMKVSFVLGSISKKILGADENVKTEEIRKLVASKNHSKEATGDELDILGVLRMEAINKCFQKLNATVPRLPVRNLSSKQVGRATEMLKENLLICTTDQDVISTPYFKEVNEHVEIGPVKLDQASENSEWDDEDDAEEVPDLPSHSQSGEAKMSSGKVDDDTIEVISSGDVNLEAPNFVLDLQTSRYQCPACTNNYLEKKRTRIHYEKIHLKIKYRCKLCGKKFSEKSACREHHKEKHMGRTVECSGCNQLFSRKSTLLRHRRTTSCGGGKEPKPKKPTCHCRFCGKGFVRFDALSTHLTVIHLEPQKHCCNICQRKFNRKSDMQQHKQNMHR